MLDWQKNKPFVNTFAHLTKLDTFVRNLKDSKTNQPKREVANRELILDTAIDLGSEQGWQKLTVRNLAQRLHYAPPVLYQFFKNKEDLFKAIVQRGFDELNQSLNQALSSKRAARDKLLEFGIARYLFAVHQSSLHALMFSPGAPEWHRKILSKNIQTVHQTVHGLMQSISGRNDNCKDLVLNFICLIKGYTFFTNEIYPNKHKKEIIGELDPTLEFVGAMTRFIKSIEENE